jgi:hypothetical protein
VLFRLAEVDHIDDKAGKAVGIHQVIGPGLESDLSIPEVASGFSQALAGPCSVRL